MDPREFCSRTRLVIVAGKGGVGKTTVAATLARLASRVGLSVLVVEIEGKSGLAASFDAADLRYESLVLSAPGRDGEGEVRARALTSDQALLEYLDDHGMRRISRRLSRTGALDVVATAAPGIRDILLLGKVKQIVRHREADLVVLDAPAAGHALTLLMAPRILLDTVSSGPIREQAEDALELLADSKRCQVMLVTLPEETPVNEVVECAFALEDRVGVDLGPVVVNGLYPAIDGLDGDPVAAAEAAGLALGPEEAKSMTLAAAFRSSRQALQAGQVARLAEALPLPQLHLPLLPTAGVGPAELEMLADRLDAAVRKLAP